MRVQRVLTTGSTTESWTLLGDDLRPVDPVESFLAYLAAIERSPNTVKAYAHDLKDWWCYLDGRGRTPAGSTNANVQRANSTSKPSSPSPAAASTS